MNREFFQPKTLQEALSCRNSLENSVLLAGGTDLIVLSRKDKTLEGSIIDLSKLKELKEIYIENNEIIIGAMSSYTSIIDSDLINKNAGILCQAARSVGSPQIRNRGTIGGNISNASPAADLLPPLVCLEAKVELQSMDEEGCINNRCIAVEDFITGSHETVLKKNEILVKVKFKVPSKGLGMCFKKIGRRNALAIARVNGACIVKMSENTINSIKLAIGAVASKPERFTSVEEYLRGKEVSDELLREAGSLASDYVLRKTGKRSSSDYKLPVTARFAISLIESTLDEGEKADE